ncbi:hypothetical protein TRIUR3_06415 [Triticum urartu]|uniref:Uncharacterized protein n=1 Tax=Triticum urartu TaxID=4572 RepID=M7ZID7_TRIUA|nr:hypothetical protein TRIUR3_06415 [Triticum urartu]
MAKLRANASTGHLRVYGTSLSDDGALPWKEREQDTSLLRKIEHHRDEAVKLLASHLYLRRFLDAATSVGLLDPVSNIVVSALLAAAADPVDGASALVGVDKDMKQRSLDGLVAFLTCFFPHLTDWEAVSSLIRPWELAARRSERAAKVTHQYSWSLRRVLLHTIHGFYLQALARLPGGELRSRYHRSMLKAGHCYGPFDPVTNIIVNTIWYEATFPPLSQLDELDILGTLNLMRIEAQSFYGLVSFLCTRDKDLNADQAIRFLLNTDLNMTATKHCSSVQEEQETFRAAATAAWHPRPDAQAGFLSSCKTPAVLSLLSDNGGQQQLSSQCVQQLAMLLSSAFHSTGILVQQKQPVAIYKRRLDLTMYEGRIQRRAHRRISRKVKAALSRYEVQNSEQACYQLHVVCGVNTHVSGPDESMHSIMMQKKKDPVEEDYYHHTHANFLVTRNVGSEQGCYQLHVVCGVNTYVSGPDNSMHSIMLQKKKDPVEDDYYHHTHANFLVTRNVGSVEPVRCLFCEQEGIRIVHPASGEGFHGHEVEFEKMVRGEDLFENVDYPEEYDNDRILTNSKFVTDTVADGLDEDCMYLGSDDFRIKESDGLLKGGDETKLEEAVNQLMAMVTSLAGQILDAPEECDNVDYPEKCDNDRILSNCKYVTDTVASGLNEDCMYLGSNV